MRVDGQPTILSPLRMLLLTTPLLGAVGAGGAAVSHALLDHALVRVDPFGAAVVDVGRAVGLVPLAGGASHLPGVDRCAPLERVVGTYDAVPGG